MNAMIDLILLDYLLLLVSGHRGCLLNFCYWFNCSLAVDASETVLY